MRCFFNRKDTKIFNLSSHELEEGVELAIKKAKKHLNASKSLIKDEQFAPYASALFLFALQEYGKSKLLRKSKIATKSIHPVNSNIFRGGDSHKRKIEEGLEDIPSKQILIRSEIEVKYNPSEKGKIVSLKKDIIVLKPPYLSGKFSAEGYTDIQEEIRWRTFYLDWNDKQRFWQSEYFIETDELLKLISELEPLLIKTNC
jgi:hypothetical protein